MGRHILVAVTDSRHRDSAGATLSRWLRCFCATCMFVAGTHNAGAQTDVPVAVNFPNMVVDLFTAVSYNPRYRDGALYVSGINGIATVGLPSTRVAEISRVKKILSVGGLGARSGVFALDGNSSELRVHDPGVPGSTLVSGGSQYMTDMWMNRADAQLMALDVGPTLDTQRRGALIWIYSTETRDSITGFQIQRSINSLDYPRCPCQVAADPNDFRKIYAIANGSDTVTAHVFKLAPYASAYGQIVVESPPGTFAGLSQIVADNTRAYVTDSQGRLHTVTPLRPALQFVGETLNLNTMLTNVIIRGELIRDTAPLTNYFYEVGLGPNVNPAAPSEIKVYSEAVLVATIPTSTNKLGPLTFSPTEIFFWDGPEIKAIHRGTWEVRTIANPPADGAGIAMHYDEFDNVLRIPIADRNVVAVVPIVSVPSIALDSVVSRKVHGTAGTFELTIDHLAPLAGLLTVEPRGTGGSHTLIFRFNAPVISIGGVSAVDAASNPVGSATATIVGNTVEVTLTGVPDNQRALIFMPNINGTGINVSLAIGFLTGDVNNSRTVNSSDISAVKARSGQTTTAANFMFDVNASGSINSSDISAVKARSGLVLAP